jgi:hypothetical protein
MGSDGEVVSGTWSRDGCFWSGSGISDAFTSINRKEETWQGNGRAFVQLFIQISLHLLIYYLMEALTLISNLPHYLETAQF